jgi:sRNA-binding regulator protein Hfq
MRGHSYPIMDTTEEVLAGFRIAKRWIGQRIRVFLVGGAVLQGVLEEFEGKCILVVDGDREAMINLDHAASVTKAV